MCRCDGIEVRSFRKGMVYRKLIFNGERLAGSILVGDVRYGAYLHI